MPSVTFRLADVLRALKLPPGTRLRFGGREWMQDFDKDAVLEATLQVQPTVLASDRARAKRELRSASGK